MTGTGTEADPYIISTATDLQAIADDLDAYYELGGDIDASGTSSWNTNAGFDPITSFTGSLEGKSYTVTDLFIDRAFESVGLFHTSSGSISNLGLVTCNFTGIGAAAFVGYINTGTITKCYATGAIVANAAGAGLVTINQSTITNCYSRCSVTGDGSGFIAGFVEDNTHASAEIDDCYSTGAVSNSTFEGGFDLGDSGITNCFFDATTSGQADGGTATGKTTAQMKALTTFTDAGWDFDAIWYIRSGVNNGYPALGVAKGDEGAGVLAIVEERLHYVDAYGVERQIQGTVV